MPEPHSIIYFIHLNMTQTTILTVALWTIDIDHLAINYCQNKSKNLEEKFCHICFLIKKYRKKMNKIVLVLQPWTGPVLSFEFLFVKYIVRVKVKLSPFSDWCLLWDLWVGICNSNISLWYITLTDRLFIANIGYLHVQVASHTGEVGDGVWITTLNNDK